MSFFQDRPSPAFYARDLLYRQGTSAVPVDVENICRNLGLVILDEDLKPGFDAYLIKGQPTSRILVSSNIPRTRRRFTLAHELGHFSIPYHAESMYLCSAADLQSFTTSRQAEIEANQFAAELLVPQEFIEKDARLLPISLDSLDRLAEKYGTSLAVAAIRFLPLTVEQGAFVVSEDCRVKWSVRSPSFRYRIRRSTLSQSTRAWALFNVKNVVPWPTRVPASAWVDGVPGDLEFIEDSRFVATAKIALTTIAVWTSVQIRYRNRREQMWHLSRSLWGSRSLGKSFRQTAWTRACAPGSGTCCMTVTSVCSSSTGTASSEYVRAYDFFRGRAIKICRLAWDQVFKRPLSKFGSDLTVYEEMEKWFSECPWFEVYDSIENVICHDDYADGRARFVYQCNRVLKDEMAGCQIVALQVVPITSEVEVRAIEKVLVNSGPVAPVREHLTQSLELLSARPSPDWRNSIKESISAVEALCRIISQDRKATLSDALKAVEKRVALHGALRKAFDSLYGYTSDADGIRHSLMDEADFDLEDAVFMLVSCSAFVSFLIAKAVKAGITLKPPRA